MATNSSSFDSVYEWVRRQKVGSPILPSFAVNDLGGDVSSVEIAQAFAAMSSKGLLHRVFAVRTPSGTVLLKTFVSASKIDPVVYDQFNRPIPEEELEVLPAFIRADQ